MVTVYHLGSDRKLEFFCSPEEAVMAAYAQERRYFNTWDYREKYLQLVKVTSSKRFVYCGDWSARF